jgi:restriction system protein
VVFGCGATVLFLWALTHWPSVPADTVVEAPPVVSAAPPALEVPVAREPAEEPAPARLDLNEVDGMTGRAFERYIGDLFRQQGYSVTVTPKSNDHGADVVAKKGGRRLAVQCKRTTGSVGVSAVRDALGGKAFYRCNISMVVTNARFTKSAKEEARAARCRLVDRDILRQWIEDGGLD